MADQTATAAGRQVEVDGCTVFTRDTGTGPPLLLVQGLGHSSTAWLRTIPTFARTHRVLAPDMPGFGRSDAPDVAYDPPYFARFILDFVTALELGPVDAVGNSLGGVAIALAALDQPSVFRSVVLVDPIGFTVPPTPPLDKVMLAFTALWMSLPRTRPLIRAGYAAGFFDPTTLDEATVDEIEVRATSERARHVARKSLRAIFHFSKHLEQFHARLSGLKPRTLVVWGKNDLVLPSKDIEVVRRVFPQARIDVLDRCGHFPHIEQPEALSRLVLDFLNAA
jgi:pimeloyl-ACP methyl ester carboxylesterase